MTNATPPRRPARGAARRTTGDPYGLAAARPFVAPLLSALGLAIAALLTVALLTGSLPFLPGPAQGGTPDGQGGQGSVVLPGRTPSPSAPPVVNPDAGIKGRLVYAKAGNLWLQEGTTTKQITDTGRDSQPAWSADGEWIYFIETRQTGGTFAPQGIPVTYDLHYPILTRIHPDGSGREALVSGLYRTGPGKRYTWSYFMRDPDVSPSGTTVAVVSDGPDPTKSDVVVGLVNLAKKRLAPLGLNEQPPYGHQDPAWRPDGKVLLYVRNGKAGSGGAPTIWSYNPSTKKASRLTPAGYSEPAWSPNGRYLVATRTSSIGTDIAVLDARTGNELFRVTNDGRSWGGAWSPDGTQIAFLHLEGSTTDLRLATIKTGPGGDMSVDAIKPLTEFSGLDPASSPAWWGPRPTPAPSPSGGVPSPSGSTAP